MSAQAFAMAGHGVGARGAVAPLAAPFPAASPAPARTAARRTPLCRRGLVPVRRAGGVRCVRLRLPRVPSAAQVARTLSGLEPALRSRLSSAERAALATAERAALARLPHALARARALRAPAATAALAAAADRSASFDSGWQSAEPGTRGREHGTVTTPPDGRVGRTEEAEQELEVSPTTGQRAYVRQSFRTSVVLRECPNAKGEVTGTVLIEHQHFFKLSPAAVEKTDVQSVQAAITAPVNGDARIQPYDLSGTIRFGHEESRYISDVVSSRQRIGFLDLRVPLGAVGDRSWWGGAQDMIDFRMAESLLRRLYAEVGPRLRRLEAGWRERKQCLRVRTTPATLSGLAAGARRSVIAQAQAAAGGRDVTARIDAKATGGTVTPARTTTRIGAPARLTFTMGRSGIARITITATSSRGIGERVVTVTGTSPVPAKLTGTLTESSDRAPERGEAHRSQTIHVTFKLLRAVGGTAEYQVQAGDWQASTSGRSSDGCSYSGSGSGTINTAAPDHGGYLIFQAHGANKHSFTMLLGTEEQATFDERYTCVESAFTVKVPGSGFSLPAPGTDTDHVTPSLARVAGSETGVGANGERERRTWSLTGS